MKQRQRDLLILAAVVLGILAGAELLTRLDRWDSAQTCLGLDRDNCLPKTYLRDLRLPLEPETPASGPGQVR